MRYVDDMLMFCRSRRATERALASITKFLEQKLLLKVNREKTKVDQVRYVKFLAKNTVHLDHLIRFMRGCGQKPGLD